MANILQNIMGNTDGIKINDKVLANDALMALKGASAAYLNATLESATPDVRRMYSDFLTQCVTAHEGLTALSVKKGWYQPYQAPEEQIAESYKQADWVLSTNA